MNKLTEENIDFIYNDVREKGITMNVLVDEMVDHICCCIEPEIAKGQEFITTYTNFISTIENSVFKNIQHQTVLSINLKFQFMKKVMFISGVVATILLVVGVFFKINHLPGAGMILVLGTFTIVTTFLPLFFIVSYKEQTEKKNVMLSIIGYFTITFLILGPVFRIMHWPFTGFLFFFGPLLLATIFLPVYLVSVFRKTNETKTNFMFIIILVAIGFSFMYSLSAVNISKDVLEKYNSIYVNNLKVVEMFELKNEEINKKLKLDTTLSQLQLKNIDSIEFKTLEIKNVLDELMLSMIQKANSDKATLKSFDKKDNKKVCKQIMEINDNNKKLYELVENYQKFMIANTNNDYKKEIVNNYLSFEYFKDKNEYFNFKNSTLIDALVILSSFEKNIEMAEYEILKSF